MARPSILNLRPADRAYRPNRHERRATEHGQKNRRPSRKDALEEDRIRADACKRTAPLLANRKAAKRLSKKLDPSNWDKPPATPACSTHVWDIQDKVGGNLWMLADKLRSEHGQDTAIATVTILRGSWEMRIEELEKLHASYFLERLRVDLYACGAAKSGGGFIYGTHGEFEPVSQKVRVHIHGVAIGEMIRVIDRLRKLPGYAPIVREIDDAQ